MKKMWKEMVAGWATIASLLITKMAFAQVGTGNGGSGSVTLCDPLGSNCNPGSESFTSVANNVAHFLLTDIAIPLSVIMVLIGAFQIMTAGGDPEKFSTGRKTILYAAIGLAVALIGSGVTDIVKSIINGS